MIPILLIPVMLLLAFIVLRTYYLRSRNPKDQGDLKGYPLQESAVRQASEHLARAITFPTIARKPWEATDFQAFDDLHSFLRESYPRMHETLSMIDVGGKNLVYRWEGSDASILPALLLAHQDVVPALDADQWLHHPFAGRIEGGYVWGRGSFDAKGQLIAICEAVEGLLEANFHPKRTWYIAFGCDEEIRGSEGAARISAFSLKTNLRFAFVLDEGGVVADRVLDLVDRPIAVVGIAEKGDLHVRLSCIKQGGHSASPDNPTALAILGKAIWRLESKRPKVHITTPLRLMLRTLGMHAPFPIAMLLLNLWIARPLLMLLFGRNATLNALIRSTCAVTTAHASDTANVVSRDAVAMANVRLLPGTTAEEMVAWMRNRIADKRVSLEIVEDVKRSRPSRTTGYEYDLITKAIRTTFPTAIPTPYLMTGGTDALWYEPLSDCVFRFTPALMDGGELNRMHGKDERFSTSNMEKAMYFYMTLLSGDLA